MISDKNLLLIPIWGFAVVWAGILIYSMGPDVEETLFPIITNQSIADTVSVKDKICWNWTYTKARNAYMSRTSFMAEREDGVRFPVTEIRPDLGVPSSNSTTAVKGVTRTVPECVYIPPVLSTLDTFTIVIHRYYRPWHNLWELDQSIQSVYVKR